MVILNEGKPKYEKLDELLETQLLDIRYCNQINFIIDLKEIIRKFFRPDVNLDNCSHSSILEEISSDLINTVAHYRNYFFKKGKYTNFFILFGFDKNSSEITKEYPNYNAEYFERYLPENTDNANLEDLKTNQEEFQKYIAYKACKLVEKLSKFLPHVYFIDSSDIGEVGYCKILIENFKSNELVYILSNDSTIFHLVSSNVSVITPKGIKAELVTPDTALKILTKRDDFNFSSNLISLLLALTGVKKHSINGLTGIGYAKAITIINSLVSNDKCMDASSTIIPIEFSKLDPKNKLDSIIINNKEEIINNYNLVRTDNILNKNRINVSIKLSSIINAIPNTERLKELNSKIYTIFPLQLEMLLKGERI